MFLQTMVCTKVPPVLFPAGKAPRFGLRATCFASCGAQWLGVVVLLW